MSAGVARKCRLTKVNNFAGVENQTSACICPHNGGRFKSDATRFRFEKDFSVFSLRPFRVKAADSVFPVCRQNKLKPGI